MKDACKLARALPPLSLGRRGGVSSERDSEAAYSGDKKVLSSNYRAAGWFGGLGREAAGTPVPRVHASAGYGMGEDLQITPLVSG